MGVLDADENISEEMQRIMDFYNEYTTDDLHVITFGDELTHERTVNVQEDMRRGRTRKDRYEGLNSQPSDFHAFGNSLQVSIVITLGFTKGGGST